MNLSVRYGKRVLFENVNLEFTEGNCYGVIGANGAGKSTTLNTISGIVQSIYGNIEFNGVDITHMPADKIVEAGLVQVPEGREIFPQLTVLENIKLGAYLRKDKNAIKQDIEYVTSFFPRLSERFNQLGGTLSGGEQQMLAIARALMSKPKLLLMDEPSLGLAPKFVHGIFDVIKKINEQGTTVLLVEQNATLALSVASRGYVMETGKIVLEDKAENLMNNESVKAAYLGF